WPAHQPTRLPRSTAPMARGNAGAATPFVEERAQHRTWRGRYASAVAGNGRRADFASVDRLRRHDVDDVDPASSSLAGSPCGANRGHQLGHVRVLAMQLQLEFAGALLSEVDRVVALILVDRRQRPLHGINRQVVLTRVARPGRPRAGCLHRLDDIRDARAMDVGLDFLHGASSRAWTDGEDSSASASDASAKRSP